MREAKRVDNKARCLSEEKDINESKQRKNSIGEVHKKLLMQKNIKNQ